MPLSTYTLVIGAGGIVNNAVEAQTLAPGKLGLSGATAFSQNGMGTLTIASTVALGANNLVLSGYGPGAGVISGAISGTGGLKLARTYPDGTWTLSGANTYTGNTTLNNGILELNFQTVTTNIIDPSSALRLKGGSISLMGNASGVSAQTFTNTSFESGGSTIAVNGNGGTMTTLTLTNITRSAGSTAKFILLGNSGIVATNTPNGTLGWATAGDTDWVTITGGVGTGSTYANDTWGAGLNTDVVSAATSASGATTGTLRFNTAAASTVTLSGTNVISTGGILVTPNVGTNASLITGGTLMGASGQDLVVLQRNTSAGGSLTIASSIVDNGGATGLTKGGAGALHLTGANNYTGNTWINNGKIVFSGLNTSVGNVFVDSGATLQIGASNTLPATTAITLNSGTLLLGGAFSDTLGALTLAASSTLDFAPGGGGSLVFANSSAATWLGTLTINNYAFGTSSLQFGSDASGLTGGQLGEITFAGFTNSGAAQIDGSGFVLPTGVAIPEPSTYAALAGLAALGLAAWRRRKA